MLSCVRVLEGIFAEQLGLMALGVALERLSYTDCVLEVGHAAPGDGLVGGFVDVVDFCLLDGI